MEMSLTAADTNGYPRAQVGKKNKNKKGVPPPPPQLAAFLFEAGILLLPTKLGFPSTKCDSSLSRLPFRAARIFATATLTSQDAATPTC